MQIVPRQFQRDLEHNFHGRVRIRWSSQHEEWQIEEKVAQGLLATTPVKSESDTAIRMRDGYSFICGVKTGDRMPCPRCKRTLRVPIHEFGEVSCGYCAQQGRGSSVIAGHFELNDRLLQHLRRISAEYTWRDEIIKEIKTDEVRQELSKERELDNIAETAISDGYQRMNEIQQFGYTPKTNAMRVKET
jgi:hypothetical protein